MLILNWIETSVISIGIWITSGIYYVAANTFNIFLILSSGDLIDSSAYELIIRNFYIILGIVMLFLISFALLRGMVNPDDQKQGTTTIKKIVLNFVTSVVILGLLPIIFSFAYDVQDSIIRDYNVIGRFFGYGSIYNNNNKDNPDDYEDRIRQGAYGIVNGVWTAFFNIKTQYCDDFIAEEFSDQINASSATKLETCQNKITALGYDDVVGTSLISDDTKVANGYSFTRFSEQVEKNGDFGLYLAFSENVAEDQVQFMFILSFIGGILLIYVAISFCFDMALRMIKLIFYQLIAPIPIMLRVIPDGKLSGMYKQWLKVTVTCYLEVYLRIFIMYFTIYLCVFVRKSDFMTKYVYNFGGLTGLFTNAFVLMALVMFMRRAPKLISEVTGIDSGNMKLGIRDKLAEGGGLTAASIIGGGFTAGARNLVNSFEQDENGRWHRKEGAHTVRSTIAGVVSGGARSGRAGWNAKSYGDVRKAASSGAAGAIRARENRKAYREQHPNENIFVARANDVVQGINDWFQGGFEAEEAKIKSYNDLLAVQDRAKAATEKVMSKFSTNSKIVGMPQEFKGVSEDMANRFKNLFAGQDLATMENTISSLKNRVINRDDYATDEEYEQAVRNHNAMVSAYDSMYQQVRKETIKKVQSMVFANGVDEDGTVKPAYEIAGLKDSDISAIRAELTNAENMLNTMGRASEINLREQYDPIHEKGAGYSFDKAASDVEQARNNLHADVERKKAARAARRGNNNN